MTYDTSPPKAENKRYSEPDFKKIDNPYKREKFSPRNIRFVPGLIIDFLAFLAHYLQITHAVALNHLCNKGIYLSLDMIPSKVYCNHACSAHVMMLSSFYFSNQQNEDAYINNLIF